MTSIPPVPVPQELWDQKLHDLCELEALVETKIGHEVALIGHRMEWLVVAEAFLFGAFAATLAAGGGLGVVPKTTMLVVLSVLGVTLAALAWISVYAALAVSRHLLKARGVLDEAIREKTKIPEWPQLGNWSAREPSIRWTEAAGKATAMFVPPILMLAWAAIIVIFSIHAVIGRSRTQNATPASAHTPISSPKGSGTSRPLTTGELAGDAQSMIQLVLPPGSCLTVTTPREAKGAGSKRTRQQVQIVRPTP